MERTGKLSLILSMMFGGKTTHLMHLMETHGRVEKVLYINSIFDTRPEHTSSPDLRSITDQDSDVSSNANFRKSGSNGIYSTHNALLSPGLGTVIKNANMQKVKKLGDVAEDILNKNKVIFIDEAQFFEDLTETVVRWVDVLHKEVFVAGLTGDSNRKNFGKIHELMPHADTITLLRDTPCEPCATKGKRNIALFSHNKNDTGEKIQAGASKYMPVCRECYIALN